MFAVCVGEDHFVLRQTSQHGMQHGVRLEHAFYGHSVDEIQVIDLVDVHGDDQAAQGRAILGEQLAAQGRHLFGG